VVLVTGGNSGTGFVTARALYQAGAKVYLACRNESKARDAIREIKEAQRDVPGDEVGSVEFIQLDLGDLESVDRCADEFLQCVCDVDRLST
jgi:NAD(P)-dependent dehydrogenase (short-subunit alcohol dehydrogenase family)